MPVHAAQSLEPRTVPGIDLQLAPIPAGRLLVGLASGLVRGTAHRVWLGRYEVTHGQWRALMGSDLQAAANTAFNDKTLYSDGKESATTLDMHGGKIAKGTSAEVLLGDTVAMYLVSWTDAMKFCDALNARERKAGRLPKGYVYRLSTDAEWEYAARAGTTGAIYKGTLDILVALAPEIQ